MAESQHHSFLRHAAVYGLGTLLLQAASVVLLPLYTRYLTPSDYGILEILSRTGQFIGIVLMANGISTATFAFYCQAKSVEQRRRVSATVTALLGSVLLAGGALVVIFARPLGTLIGVDDSLLAAVGILVPFAECATIIPLCLAQARTESVYYVGVSLAMFVCRVLLITLAVAGLGLGIWGVLGASIAVSIVFGAVLNLREFRGVAFRPELRTMREVARFALPFVPGGLCFFVLGCGDRFFLVKSAGTEELGIYALACRLAAAVGMFRFVPLFKVWSARLYDAFAAPNAAVVVGRACTRMLGAYLLVGTALCVFTGDVIALLAAPQYARAAAIVAPLVLASFFTTAATLMDGAFYAQRRTGLKPWIALVAMLVMCGLYAWLIPRYGASGAVLAALGGNFFLAAATWAVSQRVFRVQYEYGRLAAMAAIGVAVVLAAARLGPGMRNIPAKLALWTALPALLWVTRLISAEEKAIAREGLRWAWQQWRKLRPRGSAETAAPESRAAVLPEYELAEDVFPATFDPPR